MAGLELDSCGTAMRKIDCIGLSRICQAIASTAHKLVVRVGLPPFEAGEEIHHVSFIAATAGLPAKRRACASRTHAQVIL